MKRFLILISLICSLFLLTSCTGGPDICNPEKNVTEEQVRNDLKENKQEYLDLIDILSNIQIAFIILYEGYSIEDIENEIIIQYFTGSKEDFDQGNITYDKSELYTLKEFDKLSQEDKDLIKTFMLNRNSKKLKIINKAAYDNKIHFKFFGLTYITYSYSSEEFSIESRSCLA